MHRPPYFYEDNGSCAGRVLLLIDPSGFTACMDRSLNTFEMSSIAVPFFADLIDRFDIAFWSDYDTKRLADHVDDLKHAIMAVHNKQLVPLFIANKETFQGGLSEIWSVYPIYGSHNTVCVGNDLTRYNKHHVTASDNFLCAQRLAPIAHTSTIIDTVGCAVPCEDRVIKVLLYLNELQRYLVYAALNLDGGMSDVRDILRRFCSYDATQRQRSVT